MAFCFHQRGLDSYEEAQFYLTLITAQITLQQLVNVDVT